MRDIIKKILTEETDEFGADYQKRFQQLEKLLPNIVDYIKKKYFDYPDLEKITLETKPIMYGSNNYKGVYIMMNIYFYQLDEKSQKTIKGDIIKEVYKLFGFDIREYASPLDISFYVLKPVEF